MKDILFLKNNLNNLSDKEKSENNKIENVKFLEQFSTLSSSYSID